LQAQDGQEDKQNTGRQNTTHTIKWYSCRFKVSRQLEQKTVDSSMATEFTPVLCGSILINF
jgi:hypothetical protein